MQEDESAARSGHSFSWESALDKDQCQGRKCATPPSPPPQPFAPTLMSLFSFYFFSSHLSFHFHSSPQCRQWLEQLLNKLFMFSHPPLDSVATPPPLFFVLLWPTRISEIHQFWSVWTPSHPLSGRRWENKGDSCLFTLMGRIFWANVLFYWVGVRVRVGHWTQVLPVWGKWSPVSFWKVASFFKISLSFFLDFSQTRFQTFNPESVHVFGDWLFPNKGIFWWKCFQLRGIYSSEGAAVAAQEKYLCETLICSLFVTRPAPQLWWPADSQKGAVTPAGQHE